ncbi:beta strand repeat-containing protein, partial [bacterium]
MKRIAITMFAILLTGTVAYSAALKQINYQGYLKENGVAVTGTKSMTFTLYDAAAAGVQLCTSGAQNISVAKGLFNYRIGSVGCDLSTIDWDNPVYLEIDVEGSTFADRELVTGTPYAIETIAVNVVFTPTGDIAATDLQTAIVELDTEKVGTAGDVMTGDLVVNANIITSGDITAATGTVTAQFLVGDGSGITNVTVNASDNTKVMKAGDGMTGALVVSQGAATAAISLYSTAADDLIYGAATGGGDLVDLEVGGNRTFYVDNTGNVYASGSVTATTYFGDGTNLTGLTSTDNTKVLKAGDGMTGAFVISQGGATASISLYNTAGGDDLIYGDQTGGGDLVDLEVGGNRTFYVDNSGNVYASAAYFGDGSNLAGLTSTDNTKVLKAGDGMTGAFVVSQGGATASISLYNTAGGDDLIYGDQTGGGDLIDLDSGGNRTFHVDNSGNVSASGTVTATAYYGDGTNLTGISSTDNTKVLKAGDGMTGALVLSQGGATASISLYNTAGGDDLIYGDQTGGGDLIDLEVGANRTFHVDNSGNVSASGTVTATAYYGDGTNLTGISSTDNTKVLKAGDGMTGNLNISSGAATATLALYNTAGGDDLIYGDQTGGGDLIDLEVGANRTFHVDNSGNVSASGTLTATAFYGDGANLTNVTGTDATRVAKTGDLMSGDLNINASLAASGNITAATGTVTADDLLLTGNATAAFFIGDGSNLTNITGTDATKVAKTGDLMSGDLNINASLAASGNITAATGTVTADDLLLTGNATAAFFIGDGSNLTNITGTDATKVAKTGDLMSGDLNINASLAASGNITAATGTVTADDLLLTGNATAAFFIGDGSNLTNVLGTDSTKVAKTGDLMSGDLNINASLAASGNITAATGTVTADDLLLTGNATAAFFIGDGSNLMNVLGTDSTKVAKTGDLMSG